MRTAIQQQIEKIEARMRLNEAAIKTVPKGQRLAYTAKIVILGQIRDDLRSLLPTEQKQIEDAFEAGQDSVACEIESGDMGESFASKWIAQNDTGANYFKKTYKSK